MEQLEGALKAISEEAERLLALDIELPPEVDEGLELILSIANYQLDVRSKQEVQRSANSEETSR